LVLGYVLGSIDFGVPVARRAGVDIYATGSGNPGVSNIYRTLGARAAGLVLLGDLGKGFVAALVGDLWPGGPVAAAAGLMAVVGHCFPVWHRFRGGRGVATALGVALVIGPWAGAGLAAGWLGVTVVTKTASAASLLAMLLYVPLLAAAGARGWTLAWAGAIAALVIARHHGNIRRLLTGTERRMKRS
jgi:glycerol-3-phosphate acyltransferase PlsY